MEAHVALAVQVRLLEELGRLLGRERRRARRRVERAEHPAVVATHQPARPEGVGRSEGVEGGLERSVTQLLERVRQREPVTRLALVARFEQGEQVARLAWQGRPRQSRHQRRAAIRSRGPPRRAPLQRLHCKALTCRCGQRLRCKAAAATAAAAAMPARCARPWLPPSRLPPSLALPALLGGRSSAGLGGARSARSRVLALGQTRGAARRLALLRTWGPPASPSGARACGSARESSGLAGLLATTLSCAQRGGGSSLPRGGRRRSHRRRVAPCVGWHQDGVTRWAHARRAVYGCHPELVAALGVQVAQMACWVQAPSVGHGHFPRAKGSVIHAVMQAVPQLHAVAFGSSGVAAGLPEQDELARSQLHDHGFGWLGHRFWPNALRSKNNKFGAANRALPRQASAPKAFVE